MYTANPLTYDNLVSSDPKERCQASRVVSQKRDVNVTSQGINSAGKPRKWEMGMKPKRVVTWVIRKERASVGVWAVNESNSRVRLKERACIYV